MLDPIDSFTGRYEFLSNFFMQGLPLLSIEHHYQAAKTDSPRWAQAILSAPSPREAKKLGRRCPMRPTWEEEKVMVMRTLLRVKFMPGTPLARRLKRTRSRYLIEGNWWGDTFWGVCRGEGQNMLGLMLMDVRSELKAHD